MSIDAFHTPWTDVAEHLRESTGLAILPFGALEQHGPQLPLGTDTATAAHVARALADRLDALLLPPIHYGDTWNNAGYPGTISISPATVTALTVDIGRSVAASGARGFVVVNGDWGNRMPLYAAMRILNDEGIIPAIALDYPGMDEAITAVRESAPAAPGLNHAEEIETSIMLAISPDDVRRERYAASYPSFPSDYGTRPMQLHTFSKSGVFGDPTTATAEKGQAILDATVEASAAVLVDFIAALGRA
ncbi:creatininase family protein [Glaciihabitans sp. dw_435]|uniref:creatininase family protein n=1 Tax=Glaciihabitans sp. dw_435 TaxID=2720081 RepID=UPI001BD5B2BB|nr:creatininase family protein [Glaciihabitans sp. dw_435]